MSRTTITEELGKEIIEMYNSGMNINQIRLHYNNHPGYNAIKTYLQKNGIIEYEEKYRGYTYDKCMRICQLYKDELIDDIYREFPKLTESKLWDICSHFGIKKGDHFWSDHDIQILKDYYGQVNMQELIEMFDKKRLPSAIKSKAGKLGLVFKLKWTPEEDAILINNYSYIEKEQMMSMLPNRTWESIVSHAKIYGLVGFHRLNERYTSEQKRFIIDNWQSMTDQEIADHLGKTSNGIMEQRNKMDLYRLKKDYSKYRDLIDLFRGYTWEWKTQSMKDCNYECILTGSKDFVIHHIVGFNIIADQALIEIEQIIPLRSISISDYSKDELDKMIEMFKEIHARYPLGVCIRENIHKLFHRIYGAGGNNEIQWNTFVKDFKEGKYDDMI